MTDYKIGDVKHRQINRVKLVLLKVPDNTYHHKLYWSDTDDRMFVDYKYAENHTGGFIVWYKEFGGKKHYPKKENVEFKEISRDAHGTWMTLIIK